MIIATFVEDDTLETAKLIHEVAFRSVDAPWEVDLVPIQGKEYQVVRFVENPQHPAYLFLVRPHLLEAH